MLIMLKQLSFTSIRFYKIQTKIYQLKVFAYDHK